MTVITPTLPERAHLLEECCASVGASLAPVQHVIGIDVDREGPARTRNRLAQDVDTPWLAFVDDDDLVDPRHFSVLLGASTGADVVYPWCRVEGRDLRLNHHFDPVALMHGNYIPVTAMIRTSLFRELGGFPEDARFEDWELWKNALRAGARFRCVPEVTWTYRFLGANRTDLGG